MGPGQDRKRFRSIRVACDPLILEGYNSKPGDPNGGPESSQYAKNDFAPGGRTGLPRTAVALVVLNFLRRLWGQSGYELEPQRPNGGSALGVLFADSVKTCFIAV